MEERKRIFTTFACLLAILCIYSEAKAHQTPEEQAQQILNATGVKGGLIVHIGCGDERLTAALHANDSYLVHGLDTNARDIDKARARIRSLGLYGKVSVDSFDGRHLPYVDNLVNLIVTEDLGGIAMDEVMRALAPLGVAYVKQNGNWKALKGCWHDELEIREKFVSSGGHLVRLSDCRLLHRPCNRYMGRSGRRHLQQSDPQR